MSTTKRILGDYTISASGNVNIAGNLNVAGTTTTVNSADTVISDRIITLNSNEVGAGVTGNYSGIEIDRGTSPTVALRWNDITDVWELTLDGTTFNTIATLDIFTGYLQNVVEDTTPQLGGNLDVNGKSITAVNNASVTLTTTGTGNIVAQTASTGNVNVSTGTFSVTASVDTRISSATRLGNLGSAPSNVSGYNTIYSSATQTGGGSGLYFVNSTTSDELVSRTKALAYSLIF